MKPSKNREKETIHIVFNIDDNYARHCGVTMSSAIRNNKEYRLHFHVLGLDISEKNKARIKRVARGEDKVSFYDIDPALVNDLPYLGEHTTITAATYVRLFLTDYLPDDIKKVLYLDCDLLVLRSLSELWNTDLDGYALAAVEDVISYSTHWMDHDDSVGYFNAGVLLVNLEYWREHNALEKFLTFLKENSDQVTHHDQDALNGVFYDKKLLVDIKWNTLARFLDRRFRDDMPGYEERCTEKPHIVHFVNRKKPWNTRSCHKFFPQYYRYQLYTPWWFLGPSKKRRK